MTVYLCPNLSTEARTSAALETLACFENRLAARVIMSAEDSVRLTGTADRTGAPEDASVLVSVGGDGSVLRAAQLAVRADRPLLGINSGRLGFLCALEMNDLPALTADALHALPVEERTMLAVALGGQTRLALNDVVIARRRLAGTLSASVCCGGRTLLSFRGDGLIAATPTGSTAYSRSAGGPVLLPDTGCIALTPICAHTPGAAPVVVSDRFEYTLRVTDVGDDAADVLADGVTLGSVTDALTVRRHDLPLRLVRGNH